MCLLLSFPFFMANTTEYEKNASSCRARAQTPSKSRSLSMQICPSIATSNVSRGNKVRSRAICLNIFHFERLECRFQETIGLRRRAIGGFAVHIHGILAVCWAGFVKLDNLLGDGNKTRSCLNACMNLTGNYTITEPAQEMSGDSRYPYGTRFV